MIYELSAYKGEELLRFEKTNTLEDAQMTVILWKREWLFDRIYIDIIDEKDASSFEREYYLRVGNVYHKSRTQIKGE